MSETPPLKNRLFILSSSETGVGMGNLLKFYSHEIRSVERGDPEEGGYKIVLESGGETFLGFDLLILEASDPEESVEDIDYDSMSDLNNLK